VHQLAGIWARMAQCFFELLGGICRFRTSRALRQRAELIAQIEAKLQQKTETLRLFTIRWILR
jgi:hypothetical protein